MSRWYCCVPIQTILRCTKMSNTCFQLSELIRITMDPPPLGSTATRENESTHQHAEDSACTLSAYPSGRRHLPRTDPPRLPVRRGSMILTPVRQSAMCPYTHMPDGMRHHAAQATTMWATCVPRDDAAACNVEALRSTVARSTAVYQQRFNQQSHIQRCGTRRRCDQRCGTLQSHTRHRSVYPPI